jgi:glycosyltransferase involved in cell wall biosynthesis
VHITPDRPAAVAFAAGLPFPPRSGLDLRVVATVRALAHVGPTGVFTLTAGPGGESGVAGDDVTVRVSRGFTAQAGSLPARSLAWLREPDGHPSDHWYDDAVMRELAAFVDGLGAEVVVLETLWLHGYIAPLHAHGAAVVLNAHGIEAALHSELARRTAAPLVQTFAQRTQRVEARAFAAVEEVWVPSSQDADTARGLYGAGIPLRVVPNAVDIERYARDAPADLPGSFTVIFTASFAYPPNVVAADRLLTAVFPALRAHIPTARLSLVGRDPSDAMRAAAAADDRIEVTGPVDDVAAHLHRASAMAVPLSEGHGTRFKVLEAFASGVPVVGSAKGLEGLDAVAHEHYLPAESDAEFAAALARLAEDRHLGAQLARRARRLVRDRYSLPIVNESVAASLAALGSQAR